VAARASCLGACTGIGFLIGTPGLHSTSGASGCEGSLTFSLGLCCWGPVSDSVIYGRTGKLSPFRRQRPLPNAQQRVLR